MILDACLDPGQVPKCLPVGSGPSLTSKFTATTT